MLSDGLRARSKHMDGSKGFPLHAELTMAKLGSWHWVTPRVVLESSKCVIQALELVHEAGWKGPGLEGQSPQQQA